MRQVSELAQSVPDPPYHPLSVCSVSNPTVTMSLPMSVTNPYAQIYMPGYPLSYHLVFLNLPFTSTKGVLIFPVSNLAQMPVTLMMVGFVES